MRPLVLVGSGTQPGEKSRQQMISQLYGRCLFAAGCQPALWGGGEAGELAAQCHGLLLPGGGDVHAHYFGGRPAPRDVVDVDRDRAELALLDAFARAGKPVLGICRGMQLINVYFGGTLCQHLNDGHQDGGHWVETGQRSTLRRLLGPRLFVNSFHHQGIRRLASGLRLGAIAVSDGLPEGLESLDGRFFGVQWHPERMMPGICQDTLADMSPLFSYFSQRCGASSF